MRKARLFSFLLAIIVAGFWITLPSGCANIIPPQGGPRDSLPPQLLSAIPKDSTVNYKGKRIVLTFDEYIDDLQDVQNNVLFTPTFKTPPAIDVKARTMTIRFKDSLGPNTTYILNFGNAIRDINENNVLRNYIYTFSTGPVLDSLTFSGKVILAENGKTDSTLIVILHRDLSDSAVRKQRPVYVSRVDSAGNFSFKNLPKDRFAVYALGDAGTQRQYLTNTQLFAFANDTVITGQTKNDTLYAYRVQAAGAPTTTASQVQTTKGGNAADRRLRFTLPTGTLDLQTDYVLNFQIPLRRFDSAQVSLTTDSTFTPASYTVSLDSSKKLLQFHSQWKEGIKYNLILAKDFAEDSTGKKLLKTDTLAFTTKKRSDYGQLKLTIRNVDVTKNPVLQFIQNDKVVFSSPIKAGRFASDLFNPGDYELRVLYDANNNGKWDAGQFFGTKRQPELVKPIEQKITVKASWDNEIERSL